MDADGGNVTRLTNNGRANFNPSWSPDGTKVAFAGTPPEPSGNTGEKDEIYTINVDGTGEKALTNNNTSDNSPDWSPDGRRIVFQGSTGLMIMNANGTEQSPLPVSGTGPAWSPDGKKITFVGPDEIATVNPDGSGQTVVTTTSNLSVFEPDWQPVTGAGTGNAGTGTAGTGNASTGNANTIGAGQRNGDRTAILEATSRRSLPDTGGADLLYPAVGLLLISGTAAALLVGRRR
jgi:LPXTG-motif cell wall-anchored protein